MSRKLSLFLPGFAAASLLIAFIISTASNSGYNFLSPVHVTANDGHDSDSLVYPIKNTITDPLGKSKSNSMDLKNPSIIVRKMEFDSVNFIYHFYNTVGGLKIGDEKTMSLNDYLKESNSVFQYNYFKERSRAQNFLQGQSQTPKLTINTPKWVQEFSGGTIDIKPQGTAELIFSYDQNTIKNPNWSLRQQRNGQFKFDQKIKLNVRGTIGDKIGLGIGYDTENQFDFDNEIKLRFEGEDDDIVKLLEAGNVSLPIQGTLITGSQSLWGVKSKLQFGKLSVTTVLSQQRSEKKEITLENGAQKNTFSISSLEYDANRHFFLNQYFRNNIFEQALAKIPIIQSPIQITRIEVWVINRNASTTDTRNIVAFADLGEPDPWNSDPDNPVHGNGSFVAPKSAYPDNNANTLYENLNADPAYRTDATVSQKLSQLNTAPVNFFNGQDYLKIDNARKLTSTEYSVDEQLGFISLNQRLDPGYALAVAYEYTYNGVRYQIGEFAQDIPPDPDKPNVLFLKLLKSTSTRTDLPMWDLMMKNIYSLGTSQVQPTDFKLDIIYEDDKSGANLNYIPEQSEPDLNGKFLLQLLGLDRLNSKQELQTDGIFDFLDGRTIMQAQGRIMFPYLEPFGRTLYKYFTDTKKADKYVFNAIYDSTQVQAEQQKQFDKFYLRGQYMGASGSEISLNNINIPPGSVKVMAGGAQLQENVDYTVDYTMGRVKIINQSVLNSGQPIKITSESNTLMSIQSKTLIGNRFDYKFNQDATVGGTMLYLKEKPLTQKVNIGDEPINNLILGLDGSYRTDSRFITKMIDKIPLIETKEKSEFLFSGEFAQLIPGHPNIIGRTGTSYLDDFEGSEVPYDLKSHNYWVMASTPQGQANIFPYGNTFNSLSYNFHRAKIAWYSIDEGFYNSNSNIDNSLISNHRMRQLFESEILANKQFSSVGITYLRSFDIAYYPSIRGSYNYDAKNILDNGQLANPESNWGGIMRKIETNDFEAANIEYIEFWMLDPYADQDFMPDDGDIYIQLGDVSEDILRDGLKTFENGYPKDGNINQVNQTIWGYVPSTTPINYSFDNDQSARKFQDVGLDGLNDEQEKTFFDTFFVKNLSSTMPVAIKDEILKDVSADNYHFFKGNDYDSMNADLLQRYINYKNTQGNSPIPKQGEPYSTSGSLSPDVEDINNDFTLNEIESYYQYHIKLHPNMVIGENFIVDKQLVKVTFKNGKTDMVNWYQFKIPIRAYEKRIGQIRDFKSIRFMRIAYTNFSNPIVTRFGRLQLVRGDWRRYLGNLSAPGELQVTDPLDLSTFDISTVNWDANGKRSPIPYKLPPGIEREKDFSTTEILEQNEQSLSFTACIEDGDAKAAYKNTNFDIRTYKRIKMFVHAEAINDQSDLQKGDLTLFLRLGTDFSSNYYEYEIPLDPTAFNTTDPAEIWKEANEINLALEEFYKVKQKRETTPGSSTNIPYHMTDEDGKGIVTVLGNPDLSNVKMIMIGIRNPRKDDPTNPNPNDAGDSKCGIIWVNELRVTDFEERGGYAAIGRVSAKLADFGKMTLTGNLKTIGFGGLEQKLQERSKEDAFGFDFQSYVELGKFFPQKSGVKIPLYYNISQSHSRPQYNPLNPDILLSTRLKLVNSPAERDSILHISETYLSRTSLNLMNVQKMKQPSVTNKPHFYKIENFLASYAYTGYYKRDINTIYDEKETHQLTLGYNYNFKEKTISPLSKTKLSKVKYLKLFTDFNFGILPQSFSFQTQIDRRMGEILYRNTGDIQTIMKPIYDRNFTMTRAYDFKYNITRTLRFAYSADVLAYFEEPTGPMTATGKDSLWESIKHFGETKTFNHKLNLTYEVPIRKIPLLDWITLRSSYTGSYSWELAPPAADSFGNVIQNSNTIQFSSMLNFVSFYSKIPFLKTINQDKSNIDKIRKKKLAAMKAKNKTNEEGKPVTLDDVQINEGFIKLSESVLRTLMTLRTVNVNYTVNQGTTLPGFDLKPQVLGNYWASNAPGLLFLAGIQDTNFRWNAAKNGWLVNNPYLNTLYLTTDVSNLTIQSTLEPIKGFKINVDMERRQSTNYQDVFRVDSLMNYHSFSPVTSGNYSISYWSFPTALMGKWSDQSSPTYNQFINNRYVVATRLSENNIIDTTTLYPVGFNKKSQQVLIPSFLAAYSKKNSNLVGLNAFPAIPAPNWRITYTGLSKIKLFQDIVKNVTFNHSYRSTYTIGNYTSSLNYTENQTLKPGENYIPKFRIQQVTISEQLKPLIGLDVNWKNNWTTKAEYASDRTVSFSLINYQLSEISNRDFTLGAGYRAKQFKSPIPIHGKRVIIEHDINFKLDMTLRVNRSTIMRLDEKAEPNNVGGTKMLVFKPTLDYVVDENLTIRFFINYSRTEPKISNSYPTSFTSGGFSVRYTLGQ